jgi:hypothetical protein
LCSFDIFCIACQSFWEWRWHGKSSLIGCQCRWHRGTDFFCLTWTGIVSQEWNRTTWLHFSLVGLILPWTPRKTGAPCTRMPLFIHVLHVYLCELKHSRRNTCIGISVEVCFFCLHRECLTSILGPCLPATWRCGRALYLFYGSQW